MKTIKIKFLTILFFFCSFQHVFLLSMDQQPQQSHNDQQDLKLENEKLTIQQALDAVKRSDFMLRKKIDELLSKELPKDSTRIYKIIKSILVDHPKIEEFTTYMYDKFIVPQQQENYNPEIPQEKKQAIQNDDANDIHKQQETLLKKQNQKKALKKRFTFLDKNLEAEKEAITALLKGGKDCPTAKENYKALASFLHPDKVLISTLTSHKNFDLLLNSNKIISFILHPSNKNKTNETLFKYINAKKTKTKHSTTTPKYFDKN